MMMMMVMTAMMGDSDCGGTAGANYQLLSIAHVSGPRICLFLKLLLFLTCLTSL